MVAVKRQLVGSSELHQPDTRLKKDESRHAQTKLSLIPTPRILRLDANALAVRVQSSLKPSRDHPTSVFPQPRYQTGAVCEPGIVTLPLN